MITMKKIHVLLIGLSDQFGGIEAFALNLCSSYDRTNYKIDIAFENQQPFYANKFKSIGIDCYLLPSSYNLIKYYYAIKKLIEKNNYNIIHINKNSLANSNQLIGVRHASSSVKIILHSHNSSPSKTKKIFYQLHHLNKKIASRYYDFGVACSTEAKNWMFSDKQQIVIINNGIDTEKFGYSNKYRKEIRNKLGISDDLLLVGNIGRLSKQKNQIRFINIFEEINNEYNNSRAIIIGDGEERDNLNSYIIQKKLSEKIKLLGKIDEVYKYLSAIDVIIMPSLYEGLSIAAIEAQASGSTLFMSDKCSKETDVTGNVSFFHLSSDNKTIANDVISKYIDNKNNQREKYSRLVRLAGYDYKNTADEMQKIYLKLIN